MPFPLAFHCWLFAPDSNTRSKLDNVRDTAEDYDSHGYGFRGLHYEPYLDSIGSDEILKKSLHIMQSVQDCAASRQRAMQPKVCHKRRWQCFPGVRFFPCYF